MCLDQNLSRQPSESLFLGTPPWEGDYLASKVNTSPSSLKLRMTFISRIIYYWNWECYMKVVLVVVEPHWFIPEKVAMFSVGNFLVLKVKVMHNSWKVLISTKQVGRVRSFLFLIFLLRKIREWIPATPSWSGWGSTLLWLKPRVMAWPLSLLKRVHPPWSSKLGLNPAETNISFMP